MPVLNSDVKEVHYYGDTPNVSSGKLHFAGNTNGLGQMSIAPEVGKLSLDNFHFDATPTGANKPVGSYFTLAVGADHTAIGGHFKGVRFTSGAYVIVWSGIVTASNNGWAYARYDPLRTADDVDWSVTTSTTKGAISIDEVWHAGVKIWPVIIVSSTHTFVWPSSGLDVHRDYANPGPIERVRIGDTIVIDLRNYQPGYEGMGISESGNIGTNQQNDPHTDAINAGYLIQTGGPAPVLKQISIDYGSGRWPMMFFEGGQVYTFKVVKGWPQDGNHGLAAWYLTDSGTTFDTDSGSYIIQLFHTTT